MMSTLRHLLQRQKENIDKIPDNAKYMIINKEDLTVVSTFAKEDIENDTMNIDEMYMGKGFLSARHSRELGCVIITITDIPEDEKPMLF